ncbi:MAG: hypothetical protein LUC43_08755 [Burkholderiales bacterium]|nr:hypothetical protein [Burkholderiales bacterium]
MYVTKRQDRLYRAYSVWAPDKNGKMRSKTVLAGFLGYYSEIIRNDPDGYEKLKAKIKNESMAAVQQKRRDDTAELLKELDKLGDTSDNNISENNNSNEPFAGHPGLDYSHYVLLPIWRELGLPRVLDYHWSAYEAEFDAPKLLYQSVVNRIVNPCSHLRHSQEKLNWLGAPLRDDTEHDLYRMLDFAYLQKDTILKTVNKNIHKMDLRDLTVVFYDCTNTWYETPFTDEQKLEMKISTKLASLGPEATEEEQKAAVEEIIDRTTSTLRMKGASKEGRHDPLISIALVVDRNGIPIDFYIYRGNASEKVTMDESIRALEGKYHIKNTIVVADGGLNTVPN